MSVSPNLAFFSVFIPSVSDRFFIELYDYHIDLCNELSWASRLAILHDNNFNIGHYTQTFQPNFLIPAILTCNILHHFHWPWRLRWSQSQRKVKTSWLHFLLHLFELIIVKFDWCWNNSSLTSLNYFWVRVWWNKVSNFCFTDCIRKLQCWRTFICLIINLDQFCYDERSC